MKALVIDFGLCIEHSRSLLNFYDEVYYYVPWQDAFPRYLNALIGSGFEDEGLIRILNMYDYIDKVDTIVVFDTFLGDFVENLRTKGYNVFGAGKEEKFENDRWYARKMQEKLGLPTQETVLISGLDNLKKYLKQNERKVVKLNTFRGSLETFIHLDYKSSEPLLSYLEQELSVVKNDIKFVVEELLTGIEPGSDLYIVNGQLPNKFLWGFEVKGAGYCGKVVNIDEHPQELHRVVKSFVSVMPEAKTFYSTEVIINEEDGKTYLIDNCIRVPMPCPSACEMVIFKNWGEIIYNGAQGKLVNPQIDENIKYVASVSLETSWVKNNFVEIYFPQEYREFIKFRKVLKKKDRIYALPDPNLFSVCAAVGYGKTLEEAIEMCKKIADEVKGYQLEHNYTGFEKIYKEIEEAQKFNLKF